MSETPDCVEVNVAPNVQAKSLPDTFTHMNDAEAAVAQHLAAFNAHDSIGLLSGFSADATWNTGQDVVKGHAELADLFDDSLWALSPSLTIVRIVADEHTVGAELDEQLTVDGQQRRFRIAAFFNVVDGLIRSAKVYREGSADIE